MLRRAMAGHLALVLLGAGVVVFAGCSGRPQFDPPPPPPPDASAFGLPRIALGSGAYTNSFDAAVDVLREERFDLARVDARSGVITTLPRSSSGFATPWIRHAQDYREAVDDTANRERRVIRLRWEPIVGADETAPTDLRTWGGPTVVFSEVAVERVYVPGRRYSPSGVELTTVARDPGLARDGLQPQHAMPIGRDDALGEALLDAIDTRTSEREDPLAGS